MLHPLTHLCWCRKDRNSHMACSKGAFQVWLYFVKAFHLSLALSLAGSGILAACWHTVERLNPWSWGWYNECKIEGYTMLQWLNSHQEDPKGLKMWYFVMSASAFILLILLVWQPLLLPNFVPFPDFPSTSEERYTLRACRNLNIETRSKYISNLNLPQPSIRSCFTMTSD